MRGTASYLHHFVGYGGYVRRLRLIGIDRLVNEYMYFGISQCAEIYIIYLVYIVY